MTDFKNVVDDGDHKKFETGAVRSGTSGKGRYDLVLALSHMIFRLARHFENGAIVYGDDNWRNGLPLRRYIDSAFRHLCQYIAGDKKEDHLIATVWNLMCHGETKHEIEIGRLPKSLDDMYKHNSIQEPERDLAEFIKEDIRRNTPVPTEPEIPAGTPMVHDGMGGVIPMEVMKTWHVLEQLKYPSTLPYTVYPTLYITGPMRGKPGLNWAAFDDATERLREAGFNVISPANEDRFRGVDPEKEVAGRLLQTIVHDDLAIIQSLRSEYGDGLALLDEWRESTGATAEVGVADWLGLPSKYVRQWIEEVNYV